MDKYWYIKPTWKLDRKKYKGIGRPKKTDYYIDKGEKIGILENDKNGNILLKISGDNLDKIFCSIGGES